MNIPELQDQNQNNESDFIQCDCGKMPLYLMTDKNGKRLGYCQDCVDKEGSQWNE